MQAQGFLGIFIFEVDILSTNSLWPFSSGEVIVEYHSRDMTKN
jgi:hypothetical protein